MPGNDNEQEITKSTGKYVGARVRMRWLILGMGQEKFADAPGITFRQVQKYEKGANRIGAGRLLRIPNILQVPVSLFFEGAPSLSMDRVHEIAEVPSSAYVSEFLAMSDGLVLITAFIRIKDAKVRRGIVNLVAELAGTGLHRDISG